MKPLVSIITVVLNGGDAIEQTIVSVVNRLEKHVEYILVDGKSTDQTLAIIKKHAKNIKWVSEEDEGIYDAMNKGIKMATGHNLYFINCGDKLLELPLKVLAEDLNADMHCFPISINANKTKHPRVNWKFKLTNTLAHQGIFYQNSAAVIYNKRYKVFADYALNLDYLKTKKKIRLHSHPVVAVHSTNGASFNRNNSKEFFKVVHEKSGVVYMVLSYIYFKFRGIYYRLYKNFTCF